MSSLTTLARPYAKAAFEVARGRDALADWNDALGFAAALVSDAQVRRLVGHPEVSDAERVALLQPTSMPEGFEALLKLLASNDRLTVLPEIAELFDGLKNEAEGTLNVTVRSAQPLDEAYARRLTEALAQRFGKTIALSSEVDAKMLGGAVVQAGDVVIDGSLRGKLARLGDALTD